MSKTQKIDQFLHKTAQIGLNIAKKGLTVLSDVAECAKTNLEKSDSFLTKEQHHKIDKAAQDLKEKVKNWWKG